MTLVYSYSESLPIFSVIKGYGYTSSRIEVGLEIPYCDERELTFFAMSISEKSLEKVWENEDDAYWESYLKE